MKTYWLKTSKEEAMINKGTFKIPVSAVKVCNMIEAVIFFIINVFETVTM